MSFVYGDQRRLQKVSSALIVFEYTLCLFAIWSERVATSFDVSKKSFADWRAIDTASLIADDILVLVGEVESQSHRRYFKLSGSDLSGHPTQFDNSCCFSQHVWRELRARTSTIDKIYGLLSFNNSPHLRVRTDFDQLRHRRLDVQGFVRRALWLTSACCSPPSRP